MKEDMYTYHYFRNRCIIRQDKTSEYILDTVLLGGVVFLLTTFLK